MNNFVSIMTVSGKGALFNDDVSRRLITLGDISNVMQFEIDRPFDGYQPYFHYEVQPLLDYKLADVN